MLTFEHAPDFRQPSVIVDVFEHGLTVRSDGRLRIVAWSAVVEVSAGRAMLDRSDGVWILVLAIGVELDGESRLFVVSEVEPAWLALAASLPVAFPGVAAVDERGAALVTMGNPVQLYLRDESRP